MEGLQVKRFLHAVLCVILFSACASAQAPCRYDPQSGLFTGRDGTPYTGVVRGYYPEGALRSFSEVKEGRLNGRQVLYYADGSVVECATGGKTAMELSGSNVLRFELADGTSIIVRPSGTEPKIKVYILTKGADAAERDANVAKYSRWVETLTP